MRWNENAAAVQGKSCPRADVTPPKPVLGLDHATTFP